ncbi:peptide ABC transporter substrate-binding protein [Dongshaea marina]|uniref:peptide ABC transporter substrate-binding protein n=1 Tax=Dongshaea marina TaxID=2047966 RepID=UPI000D3EA8EB|nr:peptide ABC transporter substrate-binding protein [Dongshaea marina]
MLKLATAFLWGAILSLFAALPLFADAPPGVKLAQQQQLVRDVGDKLDNLDPQKIGSKAEVYTSWDLFEGLVTYSPEGKVIPGVAKSWSVEQNRVYRFVLRQDARWSDGTPVVAEDFVYAWRRVVDPKNESSYAFYFEFAHIKNAFAITHGQKKPEALGVKALSPYELEVSLDRSVPYFVGMTSHPAMFPVPKALVEKFGDKWTQPDRMLSNGAYRLSWWQRGKRLELKRNPHYWNNRQTVIDKVVYLTQTSPDKQLKGYLEGKSDYTASVPLDRYQELKRLYPDELKVDDMLGITYIGFNLKRKPFDDLRVRRALSYSIDRDYITQTVLAEGQKPAYSFTPPRMPGFIYPTLKWEKMTQAERDKLAKELYQQAGFNAEKPLKFELLYNFAESHRKMSQAIAKRWREVLGVEVTLKEEPWRDYRKLVKQGDYDVARLGWVADYYAPSSMLSLFICGGSENIPRWCSKTYDSLLQKSAGQFGGRVRARFYAMAESLLAKEAPIAPVYHYVVVRLVKPYVGGYRNNLMDVHLSKDLYLVEHE